MRPKPRMADFARMGAAIAEGLGAGADVFLAAYAANHRDRADDQLSGDAVVQGLQALIAETGHWTGTPSDLLHVLSRMFDGALRKRLPSNVSVLGRRLTELAPALRQLGIECVSSRQAGGIRQRRLDVRGAEVAVPRVPRAVRLREMNPDASQGGTLCDAGAGPDVVPGGRAGTGGDGDTLGVGAAGVDLAGCGGLRDRGMDSFDPVTGEERDDA